MVGLGPDGGSLAAKVLPGTCINDVDTVDEAVMIRVEDADIVYTVCHECHGIAHQLRGIFVVSIVFIRASVVSHVLRQGNRAEDIKYGFELAVAYIVEVFAHASVVSVVAVAEVLQRTGLVKELIERLFRPVYGYGRVVEVNQYGQDVGGSVVRKISGCTRSDAPYLKAGWLLLVRMVARHDVVGLGCAPYGRVNFLSKHVYNLALPPCGQGKGEQKSDE